MYAMTYSDRQTAAEKCSRLEDNYDQCFGYLHGECSLLVANKCKSVKSLKSVISRPFLSFILTYYP